MYCTGETGEVTAQWLVQPAAESLSVMPTPDTDGSDPLAPLPKLCKTEPQAAHNASATLPLDATMKQSNMKKRIIILSHAQKLVAVAKRNWKIIYTSEPVNAALTNSVVMPAAQLAVDCQRSVYSCRQCSKVFGLSTRIDHVSSNYVVLFPVGWPARHVD